jgi:hypothetical protein
MRILVEPPPLSRCELCGGELRLKLIESANPAIGLDNELFVCVDCGREQLYAVSHHNPDPQGGLAAWRTCQALAVSSPSRVGAASRRG